MSNALGCIYLTNYSLFFLFAVHIHIVDISGYAYLRARACVCVFVCVRASAYVRACVHVLFL